MAVTASLVFKGLAASAAYIRLSRVFGGKDEGQWTGAFQMYGSEAKCYPEDRTVMVGEGEDAHSEPVPPAGDPVAQFNLAIPYQDADPRPLLYAALKERLPELYEGSNVEDA